MTSKLDLSPEEMRALGYRAVDLLVAHFRAISEQPVATRAERAALEALFTEPVPELGSPPLDVLEFLEREVFRGMTHVDHPRFFAFVPGPNNFVGAIADLLASGFNVFAGSWLAAPGAAQIELATLGWLRDACGLPASAGGLFVSGGSVANLTAIAVARNDRDARTHDAVVYCSDQAHSSIDRAVRVLGFAPERLRKLTSDERFRLDVDALRSAVSEDRAAGRRPFCVVANVGTTNTGAVDPLRELAAFCRREGLWLHADGAYGAAAVLSPEGKALLGGLDEVDSLSLDPHKWLFQPIECGCVLVRDATLLKGAFSICPEYLEDVRGADDEVNFRDYGIQLTRGFRALKLWMSLKVFGLDAFSHAISAGFELARTAEAAVRCRPGWEIVTPAQMGLVTFRYAPPGMARLAVDGHNERLVGQMIGDGYAMLSSTRLRGRTVLRLCTINPRTTEADVRGTVERLDRFASSGNPRAGEVEGAPGG